MTVVLGNTVPMLVLDPNNNRNIIIPAGDRKSHHHHCTRIPLIGNPLLVLDKFVWDPTLPHHLTTDSSRPHPLRSFFAASSKPNDSYYNGPNGGDLDGEEEDEDSSFDWEKEMKRRVKELEDFKELEKKAEELQSQMDRVDVPQQEPGLGGGDQDDDEESEEQKRLRVRKELEKVAQEQAERRATAELMFELGQKAYGKGMYGRSIEFLEAALTIIPRPTLFGGEIQIWLAMAYEANNRHADCIALYKQLEKTHPSISIRRQASELRYILQAPKLKITQEEMVTIPLIGSSYDSYAVSWTDKYKDKDQKKSWATTNQLPSSRDYLGDFLVWRPPVGLEKSQAFWIALALWLGLVGAALYLQ